MRTTVHFATNRVVADPNDVINGYKADMVSPVRPQDMTYGTAFVVGVDIENTHQGTIAQIAETKKGSFSDEAVRDLSAGGRDLLVFIHGFSNTFQNAVTDGAFNREWLSAAKTPHSDTTVIVFSWPSLGKTVTGIDLDRDYRIDQQMVRTSAPHLMAFLENLSPVLKTARQNGQRATLLVHSMGNLALEVAVESWFINKNGEDMMFDMAILAAGDCSADVFNQPNRSHLSGLTLMSKRVMICFSQGDEVLQLSEAINRIRRLGESGPLSRFNATIFPPEKFMMLDCGPIRDYPINFPDSHQYYRMSPGVRSLILSGIANG